MTTTSVPQSTSCYRHPDRESGLRCQRCGRTICGECAIAAPVGFQCPECVAGGPAAKTYAAIVGLSRPYVAFSLIAANVAVALLCLMSDPDWASGQLGGISRKGALIGGALLISRDGGVELVGVAHGEWYRVFTGAFLHGGPIHLAFNMFALWQAGLLLEGKLGRLRFGLVYAVAVIGGSFGALLLSPDHFTVGASGGVFGLFGALFVAERKGLFGRAGTSFGMLIIVNLVLTVAVPGISLGGHVGGLVAGTLAAWVMFEYQQRSLTPWVPIALATALCLALFAGCLWAATLSPDPLIRV